MPLELYYDLLSQPCRAIWIFMTANEIPFKSRPIELREGAQNSPSFLKKNPKHQVPIFEDNGFVVTESTAMPSYLARKFNLAEHWYPREDLQRQARINEFLHWHQSTIRSHASGIFINTVRTRLSLGRFPKIPFNEDLVNSLKADLAGSLDLLEELFLQDNPYIAGTEVSVADIFGVCELQQLTAVGEEELYESRPKIKAWVDRVIDSLQPHYGEACLKINGLGIKFRAAAMS